MPKMNFSREPFPSHNFLSHIHNRPLLITILNQLNSVPSLSSYLFEIDFNIILESAFRSSSWFLSFIFCKNFCCFPFAPYASLILPPSFHLIDLTIFGEEYKLGHPACRCLQIPVTSSLFIPMFSSAHYSPRYSMFFA